MISWLKTKCLRSKTIFESKCLFLPDTMQGPFFDITEFDHHLQTVYDEQRVVITYRSRETLFRDNDVLNLANELWSREYNSSLRQYVIFTVQMQSDHLVIRPVIHTRDNIYAQITDPASHSSYADIDWARFDICEKTFYVSEREQSSLQGDIFVFIHPTVILPDFYVYIGQSYIGSIHICKIANNSYIYDSHQIGCVEPLGSDNRTYSGFHVLEDSDYETSSDEYD